MRAVVVDDAAVGEPREGEAVLLGECGGEQAAIGEPEGACRFDVEAAASLVELGELLLDVVGGGVVAAVDADHAIVPMDDGESEGLESGP